MLRPERHMRRTLKAAGGLAAATLALALVLACVRGPLATPTAPLPTPTAPLVVLTPTPLPSAAAPGPSPRRARLSAADGYIAADEGLSPFATDHPAVGNLAPDLLAAVQQAATDAARDGVDLMITSGWRSARYQQALLDAAIVDYGSEAEARRWVNTPEQSTHVTGNAVDIGSTAAALWLRQHGNHYGLCQIYANEPWHYELATEPGGSCPPALADASEG